MSYPIKSRTTRLQLRTLLQANPTFNLLSSDQQNYCIDKAIQKVCDFRNALDKEDYLADSTSNAMVIQSVTSNVGTTVQRTAYGTTLTSNDYGTEFFDTDDNRPYWWSSEGWV